MVAKNSAIGMAISTHDAWALEDQVALEREHHDQCEEETEDRESVEVAA